jgi:hypothetical protein
MFYLDVPVFQSIGTPPGRYQDFVGAFSRKPDSWPDLSIDTARLHSLYTWYGDQLWNKDCPALPEVNWSVRLFGTEILYKYKSCYGDAHPLGNTRDFHGNPVAHRMSTALFRTAHFNFTPLAIDSSSMQIVVDSLLNWLYDPTLGSLTVSDNRYPEAQVKVSVAESKERYRERVERYTKEDQELITIE